MKEPQTEAYKGVFKGISENLNTSVGKYMPPLSNTMKRHNYQIGWEPWQQSHKSIYNLHHDQKEVFDNRAQINPKARSTAIQIGNPDYKVPIQDHFTSEAGRNFRGNQNAERAKPVLAKQKLMATQIDFGQEKMEYKTISQVNHGDNLKLPPASDIKYKSHAVRYDIITNKDVPKERLQNACQFDYWNEHKSKRHISANHSDFPTGKLGRVDPITNRIFVK